MTRYILQKIARIIKSNRLTFVINIWGLSIGIASFIILMLWIYQEKEYNRFLKNENIYQVITNYTVNGEIKSARSTSYPLIRSMSQGISGIDAVAFTSEMDDVNLEMGNKQTRSSGRYANTDFFKVFPVKFLLGGPDQVLSDPSSIVISSQVAERLYGADWRRKMEDNILSVDNGKKWSVKGVFETFPKSSTIRSDFFLPMPKDSNEYVGNYNYETYLKLGKHINPLTTAAKINQKIAGLTKAGIYLQPFGDIHLYSNFSNGKVEGGRVLYVQLFTVMAFFLLGMACINFMNLNIASSFKRTKELSIKRMMGASRVSLIRQLVGEAYVIVFISIVLGLLIVYFSLPSINFYLSETISFPFLSSGFWIFIGVIFVLTGLLASIYPAIMLTSFNPLRVLKSEQGSSIGGIGILKVLFSFQFFISVLLMYIAFTTNRQIQYLLHKDLGYNKQYIIGKKLSKDEIQKIPLLKEQLKSKSFFSGHTFSSSDLVTGTPMTGDVSWPGKKPEDSIRFAMLYTDKDFIKTFQIKMTAGNFGAEFGADLPVVVNKSAARLMGGEAAILNKIINVFGEKGRVTGIVEDFHFNSLYNPIEPLIIAEFPSEAEYIFAHPVAGREADAIAYMEELSRNDNPGKPENYFWVENKLDTLYRDEANLGRRSFLFSIVCILIAVSGFLGLINFSIIKRMREMGIRRVFGSSSQQIVFLIFRDFLKWVFIAALIAIPVSWLFLNNWLENFAYRIHINPMSFIIPLLGMAGIILLIVIYYSFRLGRINPVSVLREN